MCISVDDFTVHYDHIISIRWRFTRPMVNSPVSKQHREVTGGRWGGEGEGDSPPGVTELGNVSVPSVCFVCFFKNSVSFQITDPLINLAEVERGPPCSEEPTWQPLCLSQGGQFTNSTPPPAAPWSALRPLADCLPAGLPAWRRVKRLS